MSKLYNRLCMAAFAVLLPCLGALAQTTPTVTDVVDVEGYISAGITTLAGIVGVAVGGWFAFRMARWAMKWANLIGR
jgi:hypothetical protein